MKTKDEIYELIDKCNNYIYNGISKFEGMSYEEGIVAALEWLLEDADNPMQAIKDSY